MAKPQPEVDSSYRVELVAGRQSTRPDEVRAMWEHEGVQLGGRELRRAFEVLLVGVHRVDGVVAECSAYLEYNEQLRTDVWCYRSFTAREHRMANLSLEMAIRAREYLEQRFVSGEDPRGRGIVFEIENRGLQLISDGLWYPLLMAFIGENERGDHVRVRWFEGAKAPVPA